MADTNYNLQLNIKANDTASKSLKSVINETEKLNKEASSLGGSFENSFNKIGNAIKFVKTSIAGIAIAEAFSTAKKYIDEGLESLKAYEFQVQRLTVMAENVSGASQRQIDSLLLQADALSKVGVATNENIVASMAQFQTFDMSIEAIGKLTPAFLDYVVAEKGATASTGDFISMANGLAQALEGNYSSLTRSGFILDEETKKIIETGTEMEKVQAIVEVLNSTYEGFNEKIANSSLEGQMVANANQRAADLQAISEKFQGVALMRDDLKTSFVDGVTNLIGVTTETSELTYALNEELKKLNGELDELKQKFVDGELTLEEYSDKSQKLIIAISEVEDGLKKESARLTETRTAIKNQEKELQKAIDTYAEWNAKQDLDIYGQRRQQQELEKSSKRINELKDSLMILYSEEEVATLRTAQLTGEQVDLEKAEKQLKEIQDKLNEAQAEYDALKLDDSAKRGELKETEGRVNALTDAYNNLKTAMAGVMNMGYGPVAAPDMDKVKAEVTKFFAENKAKAQALVTSPDNGDSGAKSGGGGSKSSSAIKEAEKAEKEYTKAVEKELIDRQKAYQSYKKQQIADTKDKVEAQRLLMQYALDDQMDKIKELNDTYQDKFDDIQDKIEETEKNMKSLTDSIDKLQQSLTDLDSQENVSLANEVVKVEKALADMEKQYSDIGDIARSISEEALNGYVNYHGFDTATIKKYKEYLEELDSLYDGMNESQISALKDQIEYAKWYDNLNGIEKIKEDYKNKRNAVEDELKAKMDALDDEKTKRKELVDEQKKLQEEWLIALDDEIQKYEDMHEEKKKLEATYMDILFVDQQTQIRYYNELIKKANELAEARRRAASAGGGISGAKAGGGYVYSGNSYLVGEHGPELFTPAVSGNITPNNQITNNNGITINMEGLSVRNNGDIQSITDEIIRQIKLERNFGIA